MTTRKTQNNVDTGLLLLRVVAPTAEPCSAWLCELKYSWLYLQRRVPAFLNKGRRAVPQVVVVLSLAKPQSEAAAPGGPPTQR